MLVVGGGTAGAFSAIAAGREGARVTLLEASHFLGGIGAGGGIHIYYHGFTGGIQDEVDSRTNALSDLFGATQRLVGFHPDAKQIVLEEMATEAGVNVIYRTAPQGACLGRARRGCRGGEPHRSDALPGGGFRGWNRRCRPGGDGWRRV